MRPRLPLLTAPLVLALSVLSGCGGALHSQPPPQKWTTGFWTWQGNPPVAAPAGLTLDVLCLQAGEIYKIGRPHADEWGVNGKLPENPAPAHEYWLVFRFDRQAVPDDAAAAPLAQRFSYLRALAQQRHWNVGGIQLDIDSPTNSLPQYAGFLREVRQNLAPGTQLSITALVDWFRDGTAVGSVIQQVDEFVPQFYDLGSAAQLSGARGIAAKFDGAKWGPVFNRFQKRYRIGISSFGRAIPLSRPRQEAGASLYGGLAGPYIFNDVTPLSIGVSPAFALQTSRNDVGEIVLTYRATRKVTLGYNTFLPDDGIQFVIPTAESIGIAADSARHIGGYCAGIVIFRWPAYNEAMVMAPDEALAAAGAGPPAHSPPDTVQAIDRSCAAVMCADLYLVTANPLRPNPARYRIRSSAALEYFLPEERLPIRMTDSSNLELSLPAYAGQRRLLLGRAVSLAHTDFTIQELP